MSIDTLPMDPLVERVAWMLGRPVDDISNKEVAAALGVTTRTVQRWVARNRQLPAYTSDRLATALGWHPCVIWPEEWR